MIPLPHVLVCGGRRFNDESLLCRRLDMYTAELGRIVVMTGACRTGADVMAERWAYSHRHIVLRFHADWDAHGRAVSHYPVGMKSGMVFDYGTTRYQFEKSEIWEINGFPPMWNNQIGQCDLVVSLRLRQRHTGIHRSFTETTPHNELWMSTGKKNRPDGTTVRSVVGRHMEICSSMGEKIGVMAVPVRLRQRAMGECKQFEEGQHYIMWVCSDTARSLSCKASCVSSIQKQGGKNATCFHAFLRPCGCCDLIPVPLLRTTTNIGNPPKSESRVSLLRHGSNEQRKGIHPRECSPVLSGVQFCKGDDRLCRVFDVDTSHSQAQYECPVMGAGPIRNREMADHLARVPEAFAVAFWDGVSSGTGDMIALVRKIKVPLRIVRYEKTGRTSSADETPPRTNPPT